METVTDVCVWMIGLPASRSWALKDGPGWCCSRSTSKRWPGRWAAHRVLFLAQGLPAPGSSWSICRCRVARSRLVWKKRRWMCPDGDCPMGSWTEENDRIAGARRPLDLPGCPMDDTPGRPECPKRERGGRRAGLLCLAHRERHRRLLRRGAPRRRRRPHRHGDGPWAPYEALMVRLGPHHRQHFSTQMVNVRAGVQLLDVVPGRGSAEPTARSANQGPAFRSRIGFGTLYLSGP